MGHRMMKILLLLFPVCAYASWIVVGGQVTTADIAANAVTQAKRAALGQQVSSSCGTFTTTSGSLTNVTNLSVTITTTGRPVQLALQAASGTTGLFGGVQSAGSEQTVIAFTTALLRAGSAIATYRFDMELGQGYGREFDISPAAMNYIDVVGAGTYTYTI